MSNTSTFLKAKFLLPYVLSDALSISPKTDVSTSTLELAYDWNALRFPWLLSDTSAVSFSPSFTFQNILFSSTPGNDWVPGTADDDTLDGGAGADTMVGGAGNDTYYVDDVGDVVGENAGEGIDTVLSLVNYTLGDNVENLKLTGSGLTGTGNDLDNRIDGNEFDLLIGNGGNDLLVGGFASTLVGGSGNDSLSAASSIGFPEPGGNTMIGGTGNDYYYAFYDSIIIENAGEGHDKVYIYNEWDNLSEYSLSENIEDLRLDASIIKGIGNGLDNSISVFEDYYLNMRDNILDGGLGADTLAAGRGNDTYYVDNAGDVVIEHEDQGHDKVIVTTSYTLSANVEDLTLAGTAISGTGNDLDNVLTGNASNNSLSGGAGNDTIDGGLGNDTMVGGSGDDTYYVNSIPDRVTELAGGGTDTIISSVTYTLSSNVENLILTGSAFRGTGNALDNTIQGNDATNILNGGNGSDTLTGGAGADQFEFNLAHSGSDTVADFTLGEDLIVLSGFGLDVLEEGYNLMIDAGPTNEVATLLYNTTTGILSFDEDGMGAVEAVQIALLSTKPALTVSDFILI